MASGNVGYKRVIIIAVIGTGVAIVLDKYGIVTRIANVLPF